MNIYLKNLMACALFGSAQLVAAQGLYECASSMMTMQGNLLFVRPSLQIRPAGDAKREWSKLGVTGPCQALGVSEVLMQLQDGKINGLHITLTPGAEKVLPLLAAPIQSAITAQLSRDNDSVAMHPVSIFKADRSSFNYSIAYKKKIFSETLAWGKSIWGAQDER